MKFAIPVCTLLFAVTLYAGCTDSTGQERDYEGQDIQEQTADRERSRSVQDDDEWAEHRRNFSDRRTEDSGSRSSDQDQHDWGDDDNRTKYDHYEDFDFNFEGLEKLEDLEDMEDLEQAFAELGEAFEELGEALSEGSGKKSVHYDALRDVMPTRIRGFETKDFNGENIGALGFQLSVLEQEFIRDGGDERIDVTIVDMGSLSNAALVGLEWLDLEIDSESSSGFERTTRIDNNPAFEECEQTRRGENCSVHVLVADRFIVQVEGKGVDMDMLKDVLADMDLRHLQSLRNAGR